MENLATLRPFACHGTAGHFLVWPGSDDSPHLAQHQQIQLARRREKTRSSIGAKLAAADFGGITRRTQVLIQDLPSRCCHLISLNAAPVHPLKAGGPNHGHAEF